MMTCSAALTPTRTPAIRIQTRKSQPTGSIFHSQSFPAQNCNLTRNALFCKAAECGRVVDGLLREPALRRVPRSQHRLLQLANLPRRTVAEKVRPFSSSLAESQLTPFPVFCLLLRRSGNSQQGAVSDSAASAVKSSVQETTRVSAASLAFIVLITLCIALAIFCGIRSGKTSSAFASRL